MENENKKLDLCEKLAGCPKGTKLWSPLLGDCEFNEIRANSVVLSNNFGLHSFDKYGHYFLAAGECLIFPSRENRDWDSWECPKPKVERFDPKTLQPFDKVQVRDSNSGIWRGTFFTIFKTGDEYPVVTVDGIWMHAVPYNEDTKHLLGTNNEAPEYYRWWEDKA